MLKITSATKLRKAIVDFLQDTGYLAQILTTVG